VYILVGLLIALIVPWLFWREQKHRRRCTAQTEGVISDTKTTYRDNKSHHFPVFNYTVNGVEYSAWGHERMSIFSIKLGQKVTVLYDPSDPNICMLKQDGFRRVWWCPVFFGFGISIMVAGLYMMFAV
jgi:hypothetical protein